MPEAGLVEDQVVLPTTLVDIDGIEPHRERGDDLVPPPQLPTRPTAACHTAHGSSLSLSFMSTPIWLTSSPPSRRAIPSST